MKIGVVGLGYWGPNLVRNFLSTENIDVVACWDVQERRLKRVKQQFPSVELSSSFEDLLKDGKAEAVAIATPLSTHFDLGLKVLQSGKHLLLEKPMVMKSHEALQLVELADKKGLTLMVDHTFVYTSAVRKMKELISNGEVGEMLYFDSVRISLGLFRRDTNVVWDLASHDVSIMNFLITKEPVAVSAIGTSHFGPSQETAYLTVQFPGNLLAHFHVNWLSPVKVRKILIGGTKHMIVFDDMEPSEKVKVYNRGVDVNGEESVYKTLVQYRMGDMYAPHVEQSEALSLLAAEFVDCVQTRKKPISDGEAGLAVVRILEAAQTSLASGGKFIELTAVHGHAVKVGLNESQS